MNGYDEYEPTSLKGPINLSIYLPTHYELAIHTYIHTSTLLTL